MLQNQKTSQTVPFSRSLETRVNPVERKVFSAYMEQIAFLSPRSTPVVEALRNSNCSTVTGKINGVFWALR